MIIKRFIIIILIMIEGCSLLLALQKGMASYYSNRVHGRRMSNGEKYHKDSLTCAHATFPLGTMLKVTNVKNNKAVVVEVTDRCARHSRRIIDLSLAAAKEIGLVSAGVSMVIVERCHAERTIPYRNDDKIELPELDFEELQQPLNHKELKPVWQK